MTKTKNRITKNLITTILGLAIWGVAGVMYWLTKIETETFITLLGTGWVFFTAKDTLINGLLLNKGIIKDKTN